MVLQRTVSVHLFNSLKPRSLSLSLSMSFFSLLFVSVAFPIPSLPLPLPTRTLPDVFSSHIAFSRSSPMSPIHPTASPRPSIAYRTQTPAYLQGLVEVQQAPVPQRISQWLDVLGHQLRTAERYRSVVEVLLHSRLRIQREGEMQGASAVWRKSACVCCRHIKNHLGCVQRNM